MNEGTSQNHFSYFHKSPKKFHEQGKFSKHELADNFLKNHDSFRNHDQNHVDLDFLFQKDMTLADIDWEIFLCSFLRWKHFKQ